MNYKRSRSSGKLGKLPRKRYWKLLRRELGEKIAMVVVIAVLMIVMGLEMVKRVRSKASGRQKPSRCAGQCLKSTSLTNKKVPMAQAATQKQSKLKFLSLQATAHRTDYSVTTQRLQESLRSCGSKASLKPC